LPYRKDNAFRKNRRRDFAKLAIPANIDASIYLYITILKVDIQFRLRIRCGELIVIGPGKVSLLESIAANGSISAAARKLDMSYRRAWSLVDEMNRGLTQPVVDTSSGGSHGGGATLTDTGREVIARYRQVEQIAAQAAAEPLSVLTALVTGE
jgi:molybdate transport system regulatory protein